jgi:hypothetical protein
MYSYKYGYEHGYTSKDLYINSIITDSLETYAIDLEFDYYNLKKEYSDVQREYIALSEAVHYSIDYNYIDSIYKSNLTRLDSDKCSKALSYSSPTGDIK